MKSKWLIWAAVALAIGAGAYLGLKPSAKAEGIVNVDAAKVQQLLADQASVHVVDVRTPGEFEAGHLKGAENAPVDQIQSLAGAWDRDQPQLVYCATGSRSASAVQQLDSMGFKTIYHFNQGLVAWQGDLDSGTAQPVAQAPAVKTSGKPIMYEFFTDW